MTKILSQIFPAFKHSVVAVDGSAIDNLDEINDIPVTNLVFDSREVKENSLFFALPGTHVDGNRFIPKAILNGANAVIFQGELTEEIKKETAKAIIQRTVDNELNASDGSLKFAPVLIKVPDSRYAMAPVSSAFYDNPSERLIVIGVTGTEGKSSTVSFIWQLLRACGERAGFISTVEYSLGDDALPNPQHQTTPEATIIQHHLHLMLENGCKYAVVETSSHGLSSKLNRCGNILFDCGVFMNVTLEHLEFHKNFETYRNDKANLFRALDSHNHVKMIAGERVCVNSIGIVNLEDPSAAYFAQQTKHPVYGFTTFGKAGKSAVSEDDSVQLPEIPSNIEYMFAKNIVSSAADLSFDVTAAGKKALYSESKQLTDGNDKSKFSVKAPIPGAFNAYNLMASYSAVSSLTGLSFEEIAQKSGTLNPVKGRMTVIDEGQPFELIVDYAHTPSSFETIFPPIRKRCKGKMFALFGSGGERDLTKRPLQGKLAAEYCDYVFLADEDPRGEDSVELLRMIAAGCDESGKKENKDYFIIPDRPKAIREAFKMAGKDDIVLLLGKAHENSIIYKDFVMPYDEISEAKKALQEAGYTKTM